MAENLGMFIGDTEIERRKRQTRAVSSTEPTAEQPLTPEQIEHWRRALLPILGPYALIMPAEQIQRYRDKMQEWLDTEASTPDRKR